jgi:hypothetical protein
MDSSTPSRERGSDLFEIHDQMQANGKTMEEIVSRLSMISDRMEASDEIVKSIIGPDAPQPKRIPGRITDLYNDAEGWKQLNQRLGTICSKLDRLA